MQPMMTLDTSAWLADAAIVAILLGSDGLNNPS
jgi:hypothetical protein